MLKGSALLVQRCCRGCSVLSSAPSKFMADVASEPSLKAFGGCHSWHPPLSPWRTAFSELSSQSRSESSPQPSCPRGHQLMTHLAPSLRVVPPLVPCPQAMASAEVPERVQHLFVSLRLLQPLKHLLFSHSEGSKSNEKNDCAICSLSFSPALARQSVSLPLSDTIPWAAGGKPSNLGAFSIPDGLSPAQGAVREVCNVEKKRQGASLCLEGQSKGWRS